MIVISCDCGKDIKLRDDSAGKVFRCPDCHRKLLAPGKRPAEGGKKPAAEPAPRVEPSKQGNAPKQPEAPKHPEAPKPSAAKAAGGGAPWAAVGLLLVLFLGSVLANVLLWSRGEASPGTGDPAGEELAMAGTVSERLVEELRGQLMDRERHITRLEGDLESKEQALGARDLREEELEAEIRQLEGDVSDLEMRNSYLEHQLETGGKPAEEDPLPGMGIPLADDSQDSAPDSKTAMSMVTLKTSKGAATGFFIQDDGKIITCYHNVAGEPEVQAAYRAELRGRVYDVEIKCEVLAVDEENDLALLRAPVRFPVPALLLGSRDSVKAGDEVKVIPGPSLNRGARPTPPSRGVVTEAASRRDSNALLQTSAPVRGGDDGSPIVDRNGHVVGVVTKSNEGQFGALAIPVARALTLLEHKDGRYRVGSNLAEFQNEKAVSSIYGDAPRIEVDGDVLAMHLDEGRKVAYLLERRQRSLMAVDLESLEVTGSLELLSEPSEMTVVEDGDEAWISFSGRKTLQRVGLRNLEDLGHIQTEFVPRKVLDHPGLLSVLDKDGWCWVVVTKTGEQLKTHLRVIDIARDQKDDRLLLSQHRGLFLLDVECYVKTRKRLEKLKAGKQVVGTADKIAELEDQLTIGCSRHFAVELRDSVKTKRSFVMTDAENDRVYYQHAVLDLDDFQKVIGELPMMTHTRAENAAVAEIMKRRDNMDRFMAFSADGKLVADGTHIFDAEAHTVVGELPIPTDVLAFTEDGRTLWLFDHEIKALVRYDVPGR